MNIRRPMPTGVLKKPMLVTARSPADAGRRGSLLAPEAHSIRSP